MSKHGIEMTSRSKLCEFYLIIIFLPRKEVVEDEEGTQAIIMVDFHIKKLEMINLLILKKEKKDMATIIELFTSQIQWTNQKLNA